MFTVTKMNMKMNIKIKCYITSELRIWMIDHRIASKFKAYNRFIASLFKTMEENLTIPCFKADTYLPVSTFSAFINVFQENE
jgi:hypothetical protein